MAIGLFLAINGYRLHATLAMLSVAAGDIDDAAYADWIRQHMQSR